MTVVINRSNSWIQTRVHADVFAWIICLDIFLVILWWIVFICRSGVFVFSWLTSLVIFLVILCWIVFICRSYVFMFAWACILCLYLNVLCLCVHMSVCVRVCSVFNVLFDKLWGVTLHKYYVGGAAIVEIKRLIWKHQTRIGRMFSWLGFLIDNVYWRFTCCYLIFLFSIKCILIFDCSRFVSMLGVVWYLSFHARACASPTGSTGTQLGRSCIDKVGEAGTIPFYPPQIYTGHSLYSCVSFRAVRATGIWCYNSLANLELYLVKSVVLSWRPLLLVGYSRDSLEFGSCWIDSRI